MLFYGDESHICVEGYAPYGGSFLEKVYTAMRKLSVMRPIWEKRGLFLFYIPPYSPHPNVVETLWRIMKGK